MTKQKNPEEYSTIAYVISYCIAFFILAIIVSTGIYCLMSGIADLICGETLSGSVKLASLISGVMILKHVVKKS